MLRELVTFSYSLHSQGLFGMRRKKILKRHWFQGARMNGEEHLRQLFSRLYYDQHTEIAGDFKISGVIST